MKFRLLNKKSICSENIPVSKGIYVLILKVENDCFLRVGSLGNIKFKKGYYAYVGSALGGLRTRLKRHITKNKVLRWHIDYLLTCAEIVNIAYIETDDKIEDDVACWFYNRFESIVKFGASDSKICLSHLFFAKRKRDFIKELDRFSYI